MIDLALNGLVAAFVFYATIIILPFVAIIALFIAFFNRDREKGISEHRAFNFFLSAIIVLIFDLLIMVVFASNHKTLTPDEAASLDWWMFYVWIPVQFVSVIAVSYVFKRIRM